MQSKASWAAKNLLDAPRVTRQGDDAINTRYRVGRAFSVSLEGSF